jgi:hypothetical protein
MMKKMSRYEDVMSVLSHLAEEMNAKLQRAKQLPDEDKVQALDEITLIWPHIYNTLDWKAEQEREKRLNFLMSYLNQLTLLHQSGVHLFEEIDAITQEINRELGLDYKQKGA